MGTVTVDEGEITEHRWLRPADALAARDAGELSLLPPTWIALFRLLPHPTVAAALVAARAQVPDVVTANIVPVDGGRASLWPDDAGYADSDASRPGPRRRLLMLEDGWRLERSGAG
jgi:hypothetical protein